MTRKNMDTRFVADLLKDRHSVRKFDPHFVIADEDLALILKAARFAPTSFGILNQRLLVIKNPTLRANLLPYFYYQQSFADCSTYLLFIVDQGDYILSESIFKAHQYIQDDETMTKYQIDLSNIMSSWDEKFNQQTGNNTTQWSIAQAYVAMTSAMIQAEQLGIDTTPHEGFNQVKLAGFLQEQGYITGKETVAIGLALGKVDQTKPHANNQTKVRKTKNDYVREIK